MTTGGVKRAVRKMLVIDLDKTLNYAHSHSEANRMKIPTNILYGIEDKKERDELENGIQVWDPVKKTFTQKVKGFEITKGPSDEFKAFARKFLTNPEKGPKHPALMAHAIKTAIDNGHVVAIASFTQYPEIIIPTLRLILGSDADKYIDKISIVGGFPSHGIPNNSPDGKKEHIEYLQAVHNIKAENVILVDDTGNNIDAARARNSKGVLVLEPEPTNYFYDEEGNHNFDHCFNEINNELYGEPLDDDLVGELLPEEEKIKYSPDQVRFHDEASFKASDIDVMKAINILNRQIEFDKGHQRDAYKLKSEKRMNAFKVALSKRPDIIKQIEDVNTGTLDLDFGDLVKQVLSDIPDKMDEVEDKNYTEEDYEHALDALQGVMFFRDDPRINFNDKAREIFENKLKENGSIVNALKEIGLKFKNDRDMKSTAMNILTKALEDNIQLILDKINDDLDKLSRKAEEDQDEDDQDEDDQDEEDQDAMVGVVGTAPTSRAGSPTGGSGEGVSGNRREDDIMGERSTSNSTQPGSRDVGTDVETRERVNALVKRYQLKIHSDEKSYAERNATKLLQSSRNIHRVKEGGVTKTKPKKKYPKSHL